ncbi:hypothetical protein Ciccas_003702 [Cichlidogyrus casuarinus]|uniref:Uncharacterized protein n=1 Tax=Cichlidogyrus casuarinus TaxID=1844966 RepID=A0ABD2QEE5_9PLAT
MLHFNPDKRITAAEALKMPYFTGPARPMFLHQTAITSDFNNHYYGSQPSSSTSTALKGNSLIGPQSAVYSRSSRHSMMPHINQTVVHQFNTKPCAIAALNTAYSSQPQALLTGVPTYSYGYDQVDARPQTSRTIAPARQKKTARYLNT